MWEFDRMNRLIDRRRRKDGSSLTELGPALIVFVCAFLIPVIDISFVPVRYMICQGVINEYAHSLSLVEKRSEAYSRLAANSWWIGFLSKCGVEVSNPKLSLVVCGKSVTDKLSVAQGNAVPEQWLPRGSKGPCVYSLELSADCAISPLYKSEHGGIPGFNSPVVMNLKSRSQWENLGRNPKTSEYFINE